MANKTIYLISLGDNDYYEQNSAEELLFFDNYQQIADYAIAQGLNFENINVHEMEVDDMDTAYIREIEF